MTATVPRSPDCHEGKHGTCPGLSWSDDLDAEVACPCACHPEWSP